MTRFAYRARIAAGISVFWLQNRMAQSILDAMANAISQLLRTIKGDAFLAGQQGVCPLTIISGHNHHRATAIVLRVMSRPG
jgi:hypothetical protein